MKREGQANKPSKAHQAVYIENQGSAQFVSDACVFRIRRSITPVNSELVAPTSDATVRAASACVCQ